MPSTELWYNYIYIAKRYGNIYVATQYVVCTDLSLYSVPVAS